MQIKLNSTALHGTKQYSTKFCEP